MSGAVLVTGATGFLGSALIARLLERTERQVLALVRAPDESAAQARLDALLDGLVEDPDAYRGRLRAVPGELTAPGLGLTGADRARLVSDVDAIVHAAASISFTLPLEEARAINVEGTRGVLELAEAIAADGRLDRLVHVSTAYVAGRHAGRFHEHDGWIGQDFRNTYERSKLEAETLVRERARGLPVTVVRPSIVVGESDTGWTPAFNVLYWPLQAFARGLFREVPALPQGRIDVVPIDFVADAVLEVLAAAEAPGGVLALAAGDAAPTVDELLGMGSEAFGRPRPPYAAVGAGGLAERSDQAAAYVPYFDCATVFDTTRARAALAVSPPPVADYFDVLVDFARRAKWGKRPITRVQARRAGAVAPAG